MSISEFPEVIENSLSQTADIILTDYTTIQLRGSNFKNNDAVIFADRSHNSWLWKSVNPSVLIKEFLASYIASQLEVPVPRVVIAKQGKKIGLLHQWLGAEAVELKNISKGDLNQFSMEEIFDLLLFEAFLGAIDRHGGNYLYSQRKLWGIDFGNSFTSDNLDSELSLYFDNLIESELLINQKIKSFTELVKAKNILNDKSLIFEIIDRLPLDYRAINSMKSQVEEIFNTLQANLLILEELLLSYFQKQTHYHLF
jgi:hypothetical protein